MGKGFRTVPGTQNLVNRSLAGKLEFYFIGKEETVKPVV